MYRIIIDAMGGDNGVDAVVKGALCALSEYDDISVELVGKRELIEPLIADAYADRVTVTDARDVIEMAEPPITAVRTKKDSSMVVGFERLKQGAGDAFVTAGSTGAAITGATLIVRRAKNVERAALAPLMPTINGGWVQLIDCGANSDSTASHLRQFAIMGSVYMNAVMGVENPRVALLNNGTEEEKGCALTKEAYQLLKATPHINFIGNVEARDALTGCCDVIVCDGFTGNVLMKGLEGMASMMMKLIKTELMSSTKSKIGALLSKKAFMKVKKRMDYKEYGGALMLGINGGVIKAHGNSDERAMKNAILQARSFTEKNVVAEITERLAKGE